ncbi:hypothetical protein PSOLE_09640 [Pseudomonas oleovorans subsp. oleovorans]|uniref:Uncharacterized protein n=1 Tax=Ectopseudomonas oleovorans TaxID=301 RepID=A0A379JNF2_ECTOL|nr:MULTISPECIES: hypothetical protein [Pseudomonadaceae]MCM2607198.1 hypothetical protein [Rossellomorea marisflavi]OWK48284.1 hypothetical protein PSOLE_09640 [Pseudomonas oleovorans subsp. oleovorans]SEK02717.1 hypothetical protein SAMN05216280_11071 [Pseudomonas oleovorans]SUD50179.1 Uncharacterised protein [Pseudomonas oleovorans]
MARALDWETANRNDRARKEDIEPVTPPRKGSNIDLAKRLETAIKLIESEQWATKKPGFKSQYLVQIASAYEKIIASKPSFKSSVLGKKVSTILREHS